MCKSGYCAGNNAGVTKGMCVNKGEAEAFEPCHNGFDNACKGKGAQCGKFLIAPTDEDYYEYMCCPGRTSIPGGWTTEICANMKLPGDTCPSTDDDECQGDKGCGQVTNQSNGKTEYKCCENDVFVHGHIDVCKGSAKKGEKCVTTADDECEGDKGCARRSREDSTYVCCEHGTGTYGGNDYCRKVLGIGEPCQFDDQCKSNECETFTDGVSTCVGSGRMDCNCEYFNGGCKITQKAPNNHACLCRYMSTWTCSGYTTLCRWPDRETCKNPDKSKDSCMQGKAYDANPDCGGY